MAELPALDIGNIRECLSTLVSQAQNTQIIKQADQFLAECERHPMFYKYLLQIFETEEVGIFFFFFLKRGKVEIYFFTHI